MIRRAIYAFAAILVSSLLASCGGGGPEVSKYTFDLQEAWANQFEQTGSVNFTLSGNILGIFVTGSGVLTRGPVAERSFESIAGFEKTTTIAGIITVNGITEPLDDWFTEYFTASYMPLGRVDDSSYQAVTSWAPPPFDAKVGDAGPMFTMESWDSASKLSYYGSVDISYAVAADSATSVLFKLINSTTDDLGYYTATSIITFRVTTTGALTIVSETYQDADGTMTVSYQ